MFEFETISEQTLFPDLYKDTLWGSKTWPEVEPVWSDAIDVIDGRDTFAKTWDLERLQPIAWDGAFKNVKHIEVYRPYKSFGVPPYVVCISLKKDQAEKVHGLQSMGLVPWSTVFYDRNHKTFCAQKNSESEIYNMISILDAQL